MPEQKSGRSEWAKRQVEGGKRLNDILPETISEAVVKLANQGIRPTPGLVAAAVGEPNLTKRLIRPAKEGSFASDQKSAYRNAYEENLPSGIMDSPPPESEESRIDISEDK